MTVNVYFKTTQQAIEFRTCYKDVKEITLNTDNSFELKQGSGVITVYSNHHLYEIIPDRLQVKQIKKGVFVDA